MQRALGVFIGIGMLAAMAAVVIAFRILFFVPPPVTVGAAPSNKSQDRLCSVARNGRLWCAE